MRVAFPLIESRVWTGGYQYLQNLFRAVSRYDAGRVTSVLFCGEDAPESDLQPFRTIPGVEIVRSPVFDRRQKLLRLMRALLTGRDADVLKLFQQHGIDVAFENAVFWGWRFPIPTIAWLPDFQHRHLRDQFSFLAFWKRDIGFRAQVASGRSIMLSSDDAARDCLRFYPRSAGKVSTVRFAAPIPSALLDPRPESVREEYGLPPLFFYLPNQFWRHKNHPVVIDALAKLKTMGVDAVVAASGNPSDPRHPGYLEELRARMVKAGVEQNFRLLGLVPRIHVISLMRTCVALINPSCFEGWSSTVEEARALGVRMLLSDLAVHREQMGADAIYFSPDDATALAIGMKTVIDEFEDRGGSPPAGIGNDAQVERFSHDFANLVEHALRGARS